MSFDEGLGERIREVLGERSDVSEKRMFGGLAFLVRGRMCVGIVKDDLMVRVGPEAHEHLVREPHAREMTFTGRPMKGFVYVAPPGFESDADLRRWVGRGVSCACSLPARASGVRGARTKKRMPPTKRAARRGARHAVSGRSAPRKRGRR